METELFKWGDASSRTQAIAHGFGIIVASFLIGAIVLPLAVMQMLDPLYPIVIDGDITMGGNLLLASIQFLGFIGVVVFYLRRTGSDLVKVTMPSWRDLAWIFGGFILLYAVAGVLAWLISALGLDVATNAVIETGRENPEYFLYMIPVSLLLVGPGEELLFRGVVQGLFRRAFGLVPAIVVTSILFGGVHYLALVGEGQFAYIAIAIGLGLVLGTVYELSGTIVVPIVIHGLWNALLFTVQWYGATNPEVFGAATLLF
ncbi:MAG: CPBP family intramembrane glutamic endopeptidase [Halorhabdus sp.]